MRDFLTAPPSSGPAKQLPVDTISQYNAMLMQQTELLRDIRLALYKQNPDVRAATYVFNAANNRITDTAPHRVNFQLGGKPVNVYQTLFYSSYNQNIYLALDGMSNALDGIRFAAGDVLVLPVALDTVTIQIPTLSNSSCYINGPSNTTDGGFFILAWTIPDFEEIGR